MFRRYALALIAVLFACPASAAELLKFDRARFEAAQAAGEPIFVEVHASWCPVCQKQEPTLAFLFDDAAFEKLKVFKVDFDTQKDALKLLRVNKQSTLISFKGRTEAGRSVGVTDPDEIEKLMREAL